MDHRDSRTPRVRRAALAVALASVLGAAVAAVGAGDSQSSAAGVRPRVLLVGSYHGIANFLFRDAVLNARSPFAMTRPPYQQRNFNSSVSGPVIAEKFTLNLNFRNNENESSDTIRAILPSGPLSDAVVMPNVNRAGNARGQWTLTPNNTVAFNLDYQHIHNDNQGIGGFVLASRAWTRHAQNTEYQVRETAVLNRQLVHEARFSYRRDFSRTRPISDDISIDVLEDNECRYISSRVGGRVADHLNATRRSRNERCDAARNRQRDRRSDADQPPSWRHRPWLSPGDPASGRREPRRMGGRLVPQYVSTQD